MKVGVICEPQPLRKKVKVKVEETEHTTVVPPLGSTFSASDALMTVTHATCHGSTGSPSALSEEDSKGGVTVLEGSKVLARGTRSCT